MNRNGAALILSYLVIAVLVVLGAGLMSRSIAEYNICQRHVHTVNSFWLAEAGMTEAFNGLETDFETTGDNLYSGNLSQGQYSVDIEIVGTGSVLRKIVSYGSITGIGLASTERIIEALVARGTPIDFGDYAIYSAGDVDFNGDRYTVEGDVLYALDIDQTHDNINGEVVYDDTARPLAGLDYGVLLLISQTQGNYYDAARLHDVRVGLDNYPTSFWYTEPTDSSDPTTGEPNIIYIDGDFPLNGNIGTIGGFFVVVGDVLTNPDNIYDTSINGCGQIEGVVYTRGDFVINGGAGGLNIHGTVYAGDEARLNGNSHVTYCSDYIDALRDYLDNDEVRFVSWRDTQNPFKLSP